MAFVSPVVEHWLEGEIALLNDTLNTFVLTGMLMFDTWSQEQTL